MRQLNYHTTSILWLSLEDFHNAGIPPERSREIIEKIVDPGSATGQHLRCEVQGFNHNWNVRTMLTDPISLDSLVGYIHFALEQEVAKMKGVTDPIWRCTWCGKDTPTSQCAVCGSTSSVHDRTKDHSPEWSRATLDTVVCKICDRTASYDVMQLGGGICYPNDHE